MVKKVQARQVFVASMPTLTPEKSRCVPSCRLAILRIHEPHREIPKPDGKVYDARNVHLLTRDRRFGKLRYKRSRAQQKQLLISEGCEFFKDDSRKLRYVGFYGDKRTKRILRAALKWEVLPYLKRPQSPEGRAPVVDLDPIPTTVALVCV